MIPLQVAEVDGHSKMYSMIHVKSTPQKQGALQSGSGPWNILQPLVTPSLTKRTIGFQKAGKLLADLCNGLRSPARSRILKTRNETAPSRALLHKMTVEWRV